MASSFVLVHSPLIGPYSWRPVAAELERRGHRAAIPSLLPALKALSGFAAVIAQCVEEGVKESGMADPLVLVGHSAAGAYLPVIGTELDREVAAYVFVDARLPESGASLADQDSPHEEGRRREMAEEGMLPPWSEWFGEGSMAEVIPDEERRERFVAELRPIPMAVIHEKITFPSEWPEAPCGYLRLSEFYKPLAREALVRGWPVIEIDGEHLDTITHPERVAKLLIELLDRMENS